MGYTGRQLFQDCLGMLAFPLFFLAPGYLAGYATNLLHFRSSRLIDQALWSVVLSTAVAVLWAVHPGFPISAGTVRAGYILGGILALAIFVRENGERVRHVRLRGRYLRWTALALACLILYCLLAPLGVRLASGLYESAASQTDWSIRIQLVNASLRHGSTPLSPMFNYRGHGVPLHTYFYWYVLVAQIAFLTGIGAQSALAVSCVGAALAQIASMLLFLEYLPISSKPMRRQSAMLAMAMCVTGLDVLVFAVDLFRHRFRPDPQLALWDHTPGFLYTFLWSPHHVAGTACCLAGLVLVTSARNTDRRHYAFPAALGGVFFAAAAGISTFVTAIFLLICLFILIDAVWRGQRQLTEAIMIGAAVAAIFTIPFVHNMLISGAGSTVNAGAPIHLRPRYDGQASGIAYNSFYLLYHRTHTGNAKTAARIARVCLDFFFLIVDLGLILFVAFDRFRKDWPQRRSLNYPERLLWIMFLTASVPCFFISSANISHSANDAGFHAASILRLVAALWAVPLLIRYFDQRGSFTGLQRFGVALFVLGALSQAVQLFENRFQMALVDKGLVTALPVGERVPHVARRFDQIREAMDAAARLTPPDSTIQIYPHDRLAPALLMYTHRQFAASDDGCNLPFGGDEVQCSQMVSQFNGLFGGTPKYHGSPGVIPLTLLNPALTTSDNFARVCRENHLSAIFADYTSPAWQRPGTWIWTLTPAYANPTARVFLCPANSQAG